MGKMARKNKNKTNRNENKLNKKSIIRHVCKICKKGFKRNQNLHLHGSTAHSEIVEKLICPLWPKCSSLKRSNGFYSTKSNLQVHLDKHHKFFPMPKKLKKVNLCLDQSKCKMFNHFRNYFNRIFFKKISSRWCLAANK